jgi:hypothetical protein
MSSAKAKRSNPVRQDGEILLLYEEADEVVDWARICPLRQQVACILFRPNFAPYMGIKTERVRGIPLFRLPVHRRCLLAVGCLRSPLLSLRSSCGGEGARRIYWRRRPAAQLLLPWLFVRQGRESRRLVVQSRLSLGLCTTVQELRVRSSG